MAVSINSFGATLGKVAFGNAGVPKALGQVGRSMAQREGESMATTALGRLYRRGGAYGAASAFAQRGARGAMIGAGVGAAVGVGSQLSENRSYGDPAMNGVFGAALRGGLAGGALGMAVQGGMGFKNSLRQGGARSMPWYRAGANREANAMIHDVLAGGAGAQRARAASAGFGAAARGGGPGELFGGLGDKARRRGVNMLRGRG